MHGALAATAVPLPTRSAPTTFLAAALCRRLPLFHVIAASTARTLAIHTKQQFGFVSYALPLLLLQQH